MKRWLPRAPGPEFIPKNHFLGHSPIKSLQPSLSTIALYFHPHPPPQPLILHLLAHCLQTALHRHVQRDRRWGKDFCEYKFRQHCVLFSPLEIPNVHLNNKSSDKCCNEEINVISSKMLFSCSVVSDSLQPPWTAARQASRSFTVYQSWLKPMFTESVTPSNHLIFCCPLLLLSSIFPSIRIFSSESALYLSLKDITVCKMHQ